MARTSANPRRIQFNARLTEEIAAMLEEIRQHERLKNKTDCSQSDAVIAAIESYWRQIQQQQQEQEQEKEKSPV